jgi:hydrogenase maturation protease
MMPEHDKPLLVGIGSPHGDDQAGWAVADELNARHGNLANVRKATVPLDIIHWLDGITTLHIVDACHCVVLPHGADNPPASGTVHRLQWHADDDTDTPVFSSLRAAGTHDFDIVSVLKLARQLGTLPPTTIIWGIVGDSFQTGQSLSSDIAVRIPIIADQIGKELTHARKIAGAGPA